MGVNGCLNNIEVFHFIFTNKKKSRAQNFGGLKKLPNGCRSNGCHSSVIRWFVSSLIWCQTGFFFVTWDSGSIEHHKTSAATVLKKYKAGLGFTNISKSKISHCLHPQKSWQRLLWPWTQEGAGLEMEGRNKELTGLVRRWRADCRPRPGCTFQLKVRRSSNHRCN